MKRLSRDMMTDLETIKARAYQWFRKKLEAAPFCEVRVVTKGRIKFEFLRRDEPVYAGEGGNLRQRLRYHYSESMSAKKSSTLKQKLNQKGFPVDKPTHEITRFKYVVVPFDRKEIELQFHADHNINTKEKK